MIDLVKRKTTISLPIEPPDADFIRHRGKLYAATHDPQVWELYEGEPQDGARIVDADRRTV